ncbi:hypothetical protein [Thiohalorhabdus sp.]|uniref:hypothetical protein n=1 Tax=Thiohalorhabdus sp. TaxID=3094134 RepID=UPI002FC2EC7E
MPLESVAITRFRGLVNKVDPLRRNRHPEEGGMEAGLSRADNVDVDQTGRLTRAEGYEQVYTGSVTNLFVTDDEQRAYIVEGDTLKQLLPDWTTVTLRSGLTRSDFRWAEVNDAVYATNGVEFLVIDQDMVRDWGMPIPEIPEVATTAGDLPPGRYQVTATFVAPDGRESGAPRGNVIDLADPAGLQVSFDAMPYPVRVYITPTDSTTFYRAYETGETVTTWAGPLTSLVDPLQTQFLSGPPGGKVLGYRLGRMYLGQYFPEANQSAIWPSQPLGYEHFDLMDAFLLPGEIRLIAGHPQGLILGCRDAVYAYDEEQGIQKLADYGVIRGWTGTWHQGAVYFWTERGLCRGLPFENLTEATVSVPPGRYGAGAVLERHGETRYVVVVEDGGEPAYNAF